MASNISIAGVSERDIDLMLLEEFLSSCEFCGWFVRTAFKSTNGFGGFLEAKRSVTDSTGESDLEVTLRDTDGQLVKLLVENKISARFQPRQASRYIGRGESYVARGSCRIFHTIIVAPACYFGDLPGTKGFHASVTYEEVRDWFAAAQALGERRHYKVALLASAIAKATLGYDPSGDAAITAFWRDYHKLAESRTPFLEMKKPGGKPSRSTFVSFYPEQLGGLEICHKMDRGVVDLHVPGMGRSLSAIRSRVEGRTMEGMEVAQAGKSAALRLHVPRLDPHLPFACQSKEVEAGIVAAGALFQWAIKIGCRSWPRRRP